MYMSGLKPMSCSWMYYMIYAFISVPFDHERGFAYVKGRGRALSPSKSDSQCTIVWPSTMTSAVVVDWWDATTT